MSVGVMKDYKLKLRILHVSHTLTVFYYESRKRERKTRFIYEDRWDERLKTRVKMRNLHASHTLGCAIPAVIHT
jgi:hypothetical protein